MASLRTYFSILWNGPELKNVKNPASWQDLSDDDIAMYQTWYQRHDRVYNASRVMTIIVLLIFSPFFWNENSHIFHVAMWIVCVGTIIMAASGVLKCLHFNFNPFELLSPSQYMCHSTLLACNSSVQAENYRRHIISHRELIVLDACVIAELATTEQNSLVCRQLHGVV